MTSALCLFLLNSCGEVDHTKTNLKASLTFYASFDDGINADYSKGDGQLYTVPNRRLRDSVKIGLHKKFVTRENGKGKFGAGLAFGAKSQGHIYYPSKGNISYNTENWSGAISFWLSLDPAKDLKPGFCDPIQITDVSYNDAAIWVDFTKANPRDFRLGVIEDRNAWNPNPKGPDNENPIFNQLLAPVKEPPFARGEWTHILINFSGLNTNHGEASLFMNGVLKGKRANISNPFTWELEKSNMYLGLSYIGLMDELSVYDRNLTEKEIKTLFELDKGVHSLLK